MASTNPTALEIGSNEQFHRYFQDQVAAIQTQIEKLSNTASERTTEIDTCLGAIAKLSHEVKDASTYLPTYDQRTYSLSVKTLSEKLQTARLSVAPRQKFSFKNRKNAASVATKDAPESSSHQRPQLLNSEVNPALNVVSKDAKTNDEATTERVLLSINAEIRDSKNVKLHRPTFAKATSIAIFDQKSINISLPKEASGATTSGTLYDIENCVLDMSSPTTTSRPFSNFKLRNVKDSIIICGRVQGDVHMTNLRNTIIVTTCQQIRMHDSTDVQVYLECSSRSVIEGCKGISFAPLPKTLKNALSPNKEGETFKWDVKVDDFDRPVAGLSPNWDVLPEGLHLQDRLWEKIILMENNVDATHILANVSSEKSSEHNI